MKSYKAILAGAALLAVPALCSAALVTSFESGDLDGWGAGTLNGVTTMVNTDRASDGSYSAGVSFAVATNFSGWTVNNIVENDARNFLTAGSTEMSVDVYSDWANPNGWGVYGNSIKLILNYDGGWTTVDPVSDPGLANGSFQTFTFDLTSYAPTIANPALSYSSVGIAWHVGTWGGDGGGSTYTENGTQTLAVDNIHVIPEPATLGMIAFAGASLLVVRRRFMM